MGPGPLKDTSYPPNSSTILLSSLPSVSPTAVLPLFPMLSDVSLLPARTSPLSNAASNPGTPLTLFTTYGRTSAIDGQLKWSDCFLVVIMSID
ncbi:hypothetical protein J1N35_020242 [Gossypium stocksii]|uniref:Uncharacterized protein n=1 Tax=Gossypium stocksii TaxID=47602 RepID=A0A9D3ZZ26_9ROSI|nr:hypothetical protein J1N35_020242 [Gossypium stocksii]